MVLLSLVLLILSTESKMSLLDSVCLEFLILMATNYSDDDA